MANAVQTLLLGASMLLITGGAIGMHVFFGLVGTVLFLVMTFIVVGIVMFLNGGLNTGGGGSGQPRSRRTQSKGARGRGSGHRRR